MVGVVEGVQVTVTTELALMHNVPSLDVTNNLSFAAKVNPE